MSNTSWLIGVANNNSAENGDWPKKYSTDGVNAYSWSAFTTPKAVVVSSDGAITLPPNFTCQLPAKVNEDTPINAITNAFLNTLISPTLFIFIINIYFKLMQHPL